MPRDTQIPDAKASAAKPRTRRALIDLLKRQGPSSADQLAEALGLTAMAVRQHLYGLEDERIVTHDTAGTPPAGKTGKAVGRPLKLWRLTPTADRYFPDGHEALSLELIGAMTQAFGEKGLDKLLAVRAKQQVESYGQTVRHNDSVAKRLRALAKLRSAEGYMAEVKKDDAGAHLLIEHHCPICSAAATCQGLCGAELRVFQEVLGPDVTVERTDHILAGANRCAYRVVPKTKSR